MGIESDFLGLSIDNLVQTGESGYLKNYAALEYLKEKRDFWYNLSKLAGAGAAGAIVINPGVAMGGAIVSLKGLGIAVSFDRLILIVEMLLEAFGDRITIIPKVQTDEGKIELLVRTDDGMFFAFESRSKGTSRIKWREERQDFFIYNRTSKGNTRAQKWGELRDVSKNLNRSVLAFKRQKNEIIGRTKTEQKKPVTKAIIFTGKTEIDPNKCSSLQS
jgi:hypothetical protein